MHHAPFEIPGFVPQRRMLGAPGEESWEALDPHGRMVGLRLASLGSDLAAREYRTLKRLRALREPFIFPTLDVILLDDQRRLLPPAAFAQADANLSARPAVADPHARWMAVVSPLPEATLQQRLADCVRAGLPGIPPEELLPYVEVVAYGLDRLVQAQFDLGAGPMAIVHGDVKPANLVFAFGRLMIANLGLARPSDGGNLAVTSVAGTPAYLAPEVVAEKRTTHATDQYALGIAYYELRTGELPFADELPYNILKAHVQGRLILDRLAPGEREVVARATARRPEDRFPTCRAFFEALRAAMQAAAAPPAARRPDPRQAADLAALASALAAEPAPPSASSQPAAAAQTAAAGAPAVSAKPAARPSPGAEMYATAAPPAAAPGASKTPAAPAVDPPPPWVGGETFASPPAAALGGPDRSRPAASESPAGSSPAKTAPEKAVPPPPAAAVRRDDPDATAQNLFVSILDPKAAKPAAAAFGEGMGETTRPFGFGPGGGIGAPPERPAPRPAPAPQASTPVVEAKRNEPAPLQEKPSAASPKESGGASSGGASSNGGAASGGGPSSAAGSASSSGEAKRSKLSDLLDDARRVRREGVPVPAPAAPSPFPADAARWIVPGAVGGTVVVLLGIGWFLWGGRGGGGSPEDEGPAAVVLAKLPKQSFHAGETLRFQAADPARPQEGIVFRWAGEAPPGATLDEKSGAVVWTAAKSTPPGERTVVVEAERLTDRRTARVEVRVDLLPPLGPKPGEEATNSIGMKLVYVPEGSFTMGSPPSEAGRDEQEAAHPVRLTKAFYMGAWEVTQGQYREVMETQPAYFSAEGEGKSAPAPERDRLPVERVSYLDAEAFCKKLSARDAEKNAGRVYRLPTESEWEYACRAGSGGAFDSGEQLTAAHAWFRTASGAKPSAPAEAGRRTPNAWGLHDMHGNVYEWCSDWYAPDAYLRGVETDPAGPAKGYTRVVRGGSYLQSAPQCRSADRYHVPPETQDVALGFRVVCDAVEPKK